MIQEIDGWAECIYLDMKGAFDKVPQRLLWKLEYVGGWEETVENEAISWQTQSKAGGLVQENKGSPFFSGVFSWKTTYKKINLVNSYRPAHLPINAQKMQ